MGPVTVTQSYAWHYLPTCLSISLLQTTKVSICNLHYHHLLKNVHSLFKLNSSLDRQREIGYLDGLQRHVFLDKYVFKN